jgi:DNA-binding response OmpR family regulator
MRRPSGDLVSIAPMRLLVVEDEPAVADFVARGLRAEGYGVVVVADGLEGERRAVAEDFHLVVLDRMLPGRDGLEVLDGIRRQKPDLPVLLLTARGTVPDRVAGLDRGATDYVTKPFAFEELAARVRTHLRQAGQAVPTTLKANGLRIDLLTREAFADDQPVRLSAKEFNLLAYFLRHPGQVLSREQILDAVWAEDLDVSANAVEVYVGYLRRKLATRERPAPIETVRSVGYRLIRG